MIRGNGRINYPDEPASKLRRTNSKQHFGGRTSNGGVTVEPLGEGQGFVSVVYRVTVEFVDGDASPYSFVLKVPSTRHLDTFASETGNPE
ncbi:hypothetical protein AAVH_15151, partial [Aphelenchoides avenae]